MTRHSSNWGSPPAPLLPSVLRAEWSSEPAPEWIRAELNLAPSTTLGDLGENVWLNHNAAVSNRVDFYLRQLVASRRDQIAPLRVFPQGWPSQLRSDNLGLGLRATNCLKNAELYSDADALSKVTFGRLFAIRNFGVASVLEFACLAEAAMALPTAGSSEEEAFSGDALGTDKATEARTSLLLARLVELRQAVAKEPWAHDVSEMDVRFRAYFPRGHGTIPSRIDDAMRSIDAFRGKDGEQFVTSLEVAISKIAAEYSRWSLLSVEDCARALLDRLLRRPSATPDRASVLLRVLHWSGDAKSLTLEEAGAILGITRERVRQIEAVILRRLAVMPPISLPAVERTGGNHTTDADDRS